MGWVDGWGEGGGEGDLRDGVAGKAKEADGHGCCCSVGVGVVGGSGGGGGCCSKEGVSTRVSMPYRWKCVSFIIIIQRGGACPFCACRMMGARSLSWVGVGAVHVGVS